MKDAYLILMAVAILGGSCASPDVNPPAAKARTGYVDFYADDTSDLCWEIRRLRNDGDQGKIVFEEFKPRANGVVRLAFAPGEYRLAINFLNRAMTERGVANVIVEDGKVTPVRVTLVETGKTIIENREVRVGGTFYGRSGRSTKLRASEGATFRIETEAQEQVPYQPKERMASRSARD
jgi:hypothetical protein